MKHSAIEAYVPHRGTMRLLDRLIEVDEEHAVAEVDVPTDGLFVRDGAVPAWVGIEYMAQTVSAWAGARAQRLGSQPRVGFLLGTRRFEAQRPEFPGGATLRVEARCEIMGDNGLGMFDCRIFLGDDALASARVSVFEPPEGSDILAEGGAHE
jgi:predicted hotdog family 3-hydroxylacyl-ACP dehydratase